MNNKNIVKQVETYTYLDELNDGPMEVLLIGIDAQNMGTDNTFEPTGFYREHITTWLRERYFFLDGVVFAQVPVQFKHYPQVVVDKFDNELAYATNVSYNNNGVVYIYYPISESESICLSWDTTIDHWSMSSVSQPSDGTIISDKGHDIGNSLIWESR
jgi:hypothetical protein